MEELKTEIEAVGNGAHFQRLDLHIHSYGEGGSPDVTDTTNTPKQIVDTAIAQGLKVISITDHAKTENCAAAITYAADKDILVIPGVELTTTQGHLLLYAPSIADLTRVLSRLNYSGDMCTNPITQCLNEIKAVNGFGIAAHIDKEKGFELKLQGYGDDKKDLFTHAEMLGIEINNSTHLDWYTSLDEQEQRRAFVEERRQTLHEANDYNIAHVSFSDAHSLARVGKDTEGDDCLTRAKLDELTFDSLKMAFLDPAARIRAEKQIPKLVPQFIGMKVEGGFLDNQLISFNSNLTCIIGGRGTGKSTLLESLRSVSGNSSDNSLVDSEVWPEKIILIYQDESGTRHYLTKRMGEEVLNEADPDGITQVPIESYGQGDTAQTIKNSDKDPSVLLNFFDRFIDIDAEQRAEHEYREQLSANQTQIEQLELEASQLPDIRKRLVYTSSQIATLNKTHAKELIEYEQALLKERDVREEVESGLVDFEQQITAALTDRQILADIDALEVKGLLAGKTELTLLKSQRTPRRSLNRYVNSSPLGR
jgi:histidinol phosphatase-like PHP family hydrolase/energy-coupling factor transporter ATP-binding protein EcfA2